MESKILKCSNGETIVDADFYPLLSQFCWNISKGYATTSFYFKGKKHTLSMQRLVMGFPGLHVDHKNRNPLDNRKSNLRLATRSENMANQKRRNAEYSPYRGVTMNNYGKFRVNGEFMEITYSARIRKENRRYQLGSYKTAEEAAKAYDRKAYELFGEFAALNFPDEIDLKATKELR